jgi:serine protease DegQ
MLSFLLRSPRAAPRPGLWAAGVLLACAMPAAAAPEANASGVFLNAEGEVLTAAHAVANCKSLFVIKGAQVAAAMVRAVDVELDLAVLHSTLKPSLSATLAQADALPATSIGVFAEAYETLQQMPERARLRSNAMTVPGAEGLQLLSGARPGASGTAVLGADGLLLGVVVERVAAAPRATGQVLSRTSSTAPLTGATQVRAVSVAAIRPFLTAHGIAFSQSASAQLGAFQSPAARASTLAVGVLCG